MKKTKTNISVVNNVGIRRDANIHVGDKGPFPSGDILDANAVQETVNDAVTKLVDSAPEALDTLKEVAQAIEGVDGITGLVGDVQDLLNNAKENELVVAAALNDLNDRVNDIPSPMIEVTHSELVKLRNNLQLVPGLWYRIIDYVTTVREGDIHSVGHLFDILCFALDKKTLSHDAKAILSVSDNYFDNSKLNAWKIKYMLSIDEMTSENSEIESEIMGWSYNNISTDTIEIDDGILEYDGTVVFNGITYYAWRSEDDWVVRDHGWSDPHLYTLNRFPRVGGDIYALYNFGLEDITYNCINTQYAYRGVIYRMIDEFDNDCPYDFKNIQFQRGDYTNHEKMLLAVNGSIIPGTFSLGFNADTLPIPNKPNVHYVYTFDSVNNTDLTVDANYSYRPHDNKIYLEQGTYELPNIVFVECAGDALDCNHNEIVGCHQLSISIDCFNNNFLNCRQALFECCYGNRFNNILESYFRRVINSNFTGCVTNTYIGLYESDSNSLCSELVMVSGKVEGSNIGEMLKCIVSGEIRNAYLGRFYLSVFEGSMDNVELYSSTAKVCNLHQSGTIHSSHALSFTQIPYEKTYLLVLTVDENNDAVLLTPYI